MQNLAYLLILLLAAHFALSFYRGCCVAQPAFPFVKVDSKKSWDWIYPKAKTVLYVGLPIYCVLAFLLWYVQDNLIYPGAYIKISREELEQVAQSEGLVAVKDTQGTMIGYQLGGKRCQAYSRHGDCHAWKRCFGHLPHALY